LLQNINLSLFGNNNEKLAFFVNIYNTLFIHGIFECSKKKFNSENLFCESVSYIIAGYRLSLLEIKHGILRGNIRPYGFLIFLNLFFLIFLLFFFYF
jgi:hypothetical protein